MRLIHRTVLAALVLGALPAGALAAEPSGGGMPQLRFNDPWMHAQVVWLLVIFGLLYYVMSRYALPGVAEVLESRRTRIEGDLDAAQAAKARADAALAEHRAATAKARGEAQAAIAQAAQHAQAEAAAKAEVLNSRLTAQIEAAEARIGAARDAAMGALRQVATETTDALVAKLIGSADRGAIETAVDRELAARGAAAGGRA
ncbi:MAG: F0F1 ATP synthase subunit B' [Acetobacteraceae bacterium]|nr:F0F1 ATP synthase subunit B' [Acetobacteraceae bacterium]